MDGHDPYQAVSHPERISAVFDACTLGLCGPFKKSHFLVPEPVVVCILHFSQLIVQKIGGFTDTLMTPEDTVTGEEDTVFSKIPLEVGIQIAFLGKIEMILEDLAGGTDNHDAITMKEYTMPLVYSLWPALPREQ
jgi:hypothetical protein